jgi:hypothetical protein
MSDEQKPHRYFSGVGHMTAPEDVIGCCDRPSGDPIHNVFTIGTGRNQITVIPDPDVDPDRIELRNTEGRVLSRLKISSLDDDEPLQKYVRTMLGKGAATPYAAPPGFATSAIEAAARADQEAAKLAATQPTADPVPDDLIDRAREIVGRTAATFDSAGEGLAPVLEEVLRDAVAMGTGFLRIDFHPTGNPADTARDRGDWAISRVKPSTVTIREES